MVLLIFLGDFAIANVAIPEKRKWKNLYYPVLPASLKNSRLPVRQPAEK